MSSSHRTWKAKLLARRIIAFAGLTVASSLLVVSYFYLVAPTSSNEIFDLGSRSIPLAVEHSPTPTRSAEPADTFWSEMNKLKKQIEEIQSQVSSLSSEMTKIKQAVVSQNPRAGGEEDTRGTDFEFESTYTEITRALMDNTLPVQAHSSPLPSQLESMEADFWSGETDDESLGFERRLGVGQSPQADRQVEILSAECRSGVCRVQFGAPQDKIDQEIWELNVIADLTRSFNGEVTSYIQMDEDLGGVAYLNSR